TTEHQGKITLEAGKKYDIRLEYFENTGNATAQLMWSSPTQVKEIVPQSQLFSQSGNNSGELPSPGGSEVPPPPTGGGVVNPTPIDYNEKPSVVVPGSQSTLNTAGLPLLGIKVSDPDAGNSNITVTIKATDGTLNVKGGVNGGVPLSGILNNGTATVVLVGTLLQINTTLANAAGVVYQPKQAFEGRDQITVSVNDNGNTGVGGALTDVQTFSVVVGAAGTSFPNANSPLGNNLTSINYYSREFPFVDIFKMNSGFTPQRIEGGKWTTSALKLRPDGYPASLEPGQLGEAIVLTTGDFAPDGKYTVFYEGEGEIRVKSSGKEFLSTKSSQPGRMEVDFTNGGMWFQILKTNPNNPIRNVRIVMPGAENTYQKDPFNPVFLDRLSKFKVIRYMDWGETNHSNIKEWSDRTTLNSLSQGTKKGVALEHMIDLSNRLKADPWLTIPHQASDDFVRKYATMVRDRLDPNLKVYVEYSNEVWNTIFAQHTYAKDKGLQLKLSNDPFQAAMRYYSQRSVEVFKIFEEVFGGTDRLERVLAAQSASTWTQEQVLTWKDAYKNTDNLSTAPYFQGDLNDVNKVDRTLNLTVKQAIDILLEDVRTRKAQQISNSSKLAQQYGVDLVAYEGGQHLVSAYFPQAKQDAVTNFFTEVNRSPLMKDVYTEYLNTWKSNGGGLFVNFSSVTAPSKWGWWGALEYQDQDISTAPKFQALMEFIDKNPTNQ
ncbi:MAG TPA: hypothetical protein IGS53_15095, partial [Leptolyngbyaceae cyanobacterium M33_DOE_097]|nr:hypothetical protein [Leptolyngbyaceae cyanobacterium M33_DOE_097]